MENKNNYPKKFNSTIKIWDLNMKKFMKKLSNVNTPQDISMKSNSKYDDALFEKYVLANFRRN